MSLPPWLPSVSAVIPHYGDPEPTLALTHSLLSQTYRGPLDITVADDCSPEPFPDQADIRVVRREVNGGFGSTVNTGARGVTGEFLLVLNSDLEITDSFVADLVTASQAWMPAVTSPRVVDHSGAEVWTGRRFPTVRHQATEWLVPLARWRKQGRFTDAVGRDSRSHGVDHDTPVDFVVGAAMLMPRSAFEEVGGFDERFFMNSEEADLQRRLRTNGVLSVALHSPVVVHEGGGSTDPERGRSWLVASRFTYAEKWGHPTTLRAALMVATGINLAWNGARQLAGRNVDALTIARREWGFIRQRS